MDELEISGKRYISTRRAAKDNKYSPDYIGQLIRAKKVAGQKVGRSWYVEEKSLKNYLKGEKDAGSLPEFETVEEVREVAELPKAEVIDADVVEVKKSKHIVAHISVVDEDMVDEKILEPTVEVKKEISRSHYIPINMKSKKGLTYISDDAPRLPAIEKKKRVSVPKKNISIDETFVREEVLVHENILPPAPTRRRTLTKVVVLVGVGAIVFAVVAAASTSIGMVTVVREGSPSTTQFTLP